MRYQFSVILQNMCCVCTDKELHIYGGIFFLFSEIQQEIESRTGTWLRGLASLRRQRWDHHSAAAQQQPLLSLHKMLP
jgi:hypothetical protein